MKNIKKSTLILAVIAIAALIFGGVELGNKNSLNDQLTAATDKIAKIGETLGIDNIADLDVDKLVESVKEKVSSAVTNVTEAASDAVDAATDAVSGVVDEVKEAASDVVETATDAVEGAAEAVTEAVEGEAK